MCSSSTLCCVAALCCGCELECCVDSLAVSDADSLAAQWQQVKRGTPDLSEVRPRSRSVALSEEF